MNNLQQSRKRAKALVQVDQFLESRLSTLHLMMVSKSLADSSKNPKPMKKHDYFKITKAITGARLPRRDRPMKPNLLTSTRCTSNVITDTRSSRNRNQNKPPHASRLDAFPSTRTEVQRRASRVGEIKDQPFGPGVDISNLFVDSKNHDMMKLHPGKNTCAFDALHHSANGVLFASQDDIIHAISM